jgi:RHS repeat-associated protein
MTRRYNVAGQLVQQVEKDNRGELISQFDFSYDAAGNIIKEQKLPKPESVSLPPVTMTYSAANRLATYNGQAVQFDADGNMVSGPLSGEMANFSFDSRNRLVQAGSTSYRYDAENQRMGVNQTSYVINSQPALSQVLVKEENSTKTFYVYGLGLLGEEKEGEYRSYHFDFRGSTVALTDKTGKVVQRFQYGPYGELLKGEVSVTPFLFNGKFGVMTEGNGLYYMRTRFYSAEMKRFVNHDRLKGFVARGSSLNRFVFVEGNPMNFLDPFGLEMIGYQDGDIEWLYSHPRRRGLNPDEIEKITEVVGLLESTGFNGPANGICQLLKANQVMVDETLRSDVWGGVQAWTSPYTDTIYINPNLLDDYSSRGSERGLSPILFHEYEHVSDFQDDRLSKIVLVMWELVLFIPYEKRLEEQYAFEQQKLFEETLEQWSRSSSKTSEYWHRKKQHTASSCTCN